MRIRGRITSSSGRRFQQQQKKLIPHIFACHNPLLLLPLLQITEQMQQSAEERRIAALTKVAAESST
jgi:7,8-dihydro-6-hydroxymethylpterin-pyrophosphokinase